MKRKIKGRLRADTRLLLKKATQKLFYDQQFSLAKSSHPFLAQDKCIFSIHLPFYEGPPFEKTNSEIHFTHLFVLFAKKGDRTLRCRTSLVYHVRTMNLCAYEKGNKRAVKSWHEVAYEKSQTETILWPTIFAGKKLSLSCLKTDAFLAVRDCSIQGRLRGTLHCCWLLKLLPGVQEVSLSPISSGRKFSFQKFDVSITLN